MKQGISREANSCLAFKKFQVVFGTRMFSAVLHKKPPLVLMPSQKNTVLTLDFPVINIVASKVEKRWSSGNACYHSVQNLLSSRLLPKNIKIRMCKTIILLWFCMGIWSPTLREEDILKVFENRALRRIFGPRRDEVTGEGKRLHKAERHDLYSSPSITRIIKSRRMKWTGHVA
jgi:hypothetical protein